MQGEHPLWPEALSGFPHLLFESLAYFVGYRLFARSPVADPLPAELRIRISVSALLGAAIGSKIAALLDDPAATWASPLLAFGGKSIVGGLLGGLAATEIVKRALGVSTSTGDRWVRPLWVGMSIGRLGCFFSGVTDGTHGSPTAAPWGMDLGDGIPRHPTSLYEIAFLALSGLLVERLSLPSPGDRFRLFLAGYLVYRLLVEELKPSPSPFCGLSGIQLLCLLGLLYYLLETSIRRRSHPSQGGWRSASR